VGDYFELKFGRLARDFSTLHCVIFLVGACAAQMVGMGTIMTAVLEIDYGVALLIASAVTVFYSTIGGIRAVVRTDVLQFVILVGGLGAAAAILFVDYGGFSGIMAQVGEERFQLTSN
jgi:SSS family solute:Na+ symporter